MERLGSDILRSLSGRTGRDALDRALRVQRIWKQALGESLARELRPGMVEDGRLDLFTASSTWLHEARFLEQRILRALEAASPGLGLKRIRIRLDPSAAAAPPREEPIASAPPRPVSPEERERIQGVVRGVRDPEVRARLTRLFEKAASRSRETKPEDENG